MTVQPKKPGKLPLLALLACTSMVCQAEDFTFSLTRPDFKVSLPNLPQFALGKHPMRAGKPHLRALGSDGPFTVSVMTPTADAGMKAVDCAMSTIRHLGARPGVPPLENIYRARLNERTYVAIYASPSQENVMLHAHLLSAAAGGTHCIEVHVSKASSSKDDVEPWFKGFGAANIEPR